MLGTRDGMFDGQTTACTVITRIDLNIVSLMIRYIVLSALFTVLFSGQAQPAQEGYVCHIDAFSRLQNDGTMNLDTTDPIVGKEFTVDRRSGKILGRSYLVTDFTLKSWMQVPNSKPSKSLPRIHSAFSISCIWRSWSFLISSPSHFCWLLVRSFIRGDAHEMNKLLRDRLIADIDRCLTEARNCSQLAHAGLVGKVRQILVETLLIPLLSDGFRIGTGKVTDSNGSLSAETDVIIYDRRSVPPVLYDEKHGIFPIESVYYVIEVKSTLSSAEFERSIQNGVQLRSLVGRQPHSALFAFGSDLKEGKDSDRFIQRQKDMRVPLPVNIFCVAGREYGYWDPGLEAV